MGKLGAYCLVVARDPSELKQVGRMARIVHTRRRSSVSAARRRGSRRAGRRGRDARQRGGSRFPRGCALLAPKLATRGAWLALATNARIARVIGFMASRRAEESSWLRTFLFQPLRVPQWRSSGARRVRHTVWGVLGKARHEFLGKRSDSDHRDLRGGSAFLGCPHTPEADRPWIFSLCPHER